jgi:hypothetical protein
MQLSGLHCGRRRGASCGWAVASRLAVTDPAAGTSGIWHFVQMGVMADHRGALRGANTCLPRYLLHPIMPVPNTVRSGKSKAERNALCKRS